MPLGSTTVVRPYTKIIYPMRDATALPATVSISPTSTPTQAPAGVAAPLSVANAPSPEIPLISSLVRTSTNGARLTRAQRDQGARDNLPSRVQVALNTPFGKDSPSHSFTAAVQLRHVLLFVFKSDYLSVRARRNLMRASLLARRLHWLCQRYGGLDFRALRDGVPANLTTPALVARLQGLVTACFLHYNFDTPTVVRYIGGQHTAAHRDVPAILLELRRANVDADVLADLERVFTVVSPAVCNAEATERNFRAFMEYGNHKTITEDIPKTQKALAKDIRRGYVLVMDPWLVFFVPNLHRTPLGMVDLSKIHKNPRPIFDSTFRPTSWAMAINDFTNKRTEPKIVFPKAWVFYLTWLWNLRITYPREELYLGDDDVSGAFRQVKYNPNLVAMHAFLVFGVLFMSTGQTFGDCTSPANWEPVARNRQKYAQYLWHQANTLGRALKHLPTLQFAATPSPRIVSTFVQATLDAFNPGVLDSTGSRLAPQYDHHADDCLYADVKEHYLLTVASSVLALYLLLGEPSGNHRDPVSWEKFEAKITHCRKAKGFMVDTRRMEVSIPMYKREQAIDLLATWLERATYTLLEAAELLGTLNNLSEICRWARPRYFALQQDVRRTLRARYVALANWRLRHAAQIDSCQRELPESLLHRLEPLIGRKVASLLWRTRQTIPVTHFIHRELGYLHTYLANHKNRWAISIGHLVPRPPTFTTTGDASNQGGGAYCQDLLFWFSIIWSPEIRRRVNLHKKHADRIHINCLEFAVALLQLAAVTTRLQADVPGELKGTFPHGFPDILVLLCRTDNMSTKSWANKVSSTSPHAHGLIALLAALLRNTTCGFTSEWLAGHLNGTADLLSRPDLTIYPTAFCSQIYQNKPELRSWSFFHPNPAFVSLLEHLLCSSAWQGDLSLPSSLGQFEAAGCTTSCFAMP
jgi:hypothetical protein